MAWFILSEDEGTPAQHERREEAHSPLAGKRIVHHDQNQVPSIHPERESQVPSIHPERESQVPSIHPKRESQVPSIHPERESQVPSIHPERESKDKFRINENEIGLEEFNPT